MELVQKDANVICREKPVDLRQNVRQASVSSRLRTSLLRSVKPTCCASAISTPKRALEPPIVRLVVEIHRMISCRCCVSSCNRRSAVSTNPWSCEL